MGDELSSTVGLDLGGQAAAAVLAEPQVVYKKRDIMIRTRELCGESTTKTNSRAHRGRG
jgi:hypothetical protein